MKTSCPIDVAKFPFDVQECQINMASWTYDADTVEFQFNPDVDSNTPFFKVSDETLFVKNNGWEVQNLSATISPDSYNIPIMYWKIELRRKTLYYKMHLIMPTAILAFLLTLTFGLPAESGERLGMSITLLLSQVNIYYPKGNIFFPDKVFISVAFLFIYFLFFLGGTRPWPRASRYIRFKGPRA